MSVLNLSVKQYMEWKDRGLRDEDIEEKLFVSRETLQRWKREHGLNGKFHSHKGGHNRKLNPQRVKEMRALGTPYSVIQRAYGCSRTTVYRALNK